MVLLLLILYCFATTLTQAVTEFRVYSQDNPTLLPDEAAALAATEKWWNSLSASILTLFMAISGGVSWADVVAPLRTIGPFWVVLFTVYITFTYFAVLNVVTGFFCQSAAESAQKDHEQMTQHVMQHRKEYSQKLCKLLQEIDLDGSGEISIEEFEHSMQFPEVRASFEALELSVWDAKEFFSLIDQGKGGAVDLEELLEGCMMMKGFAKGLDMIRLSMHVKRLTSAMAYMISVVETHELRAGCQPTTKWFRFSS